MGGCMSSSSGDGGVATQPKSRSKTKAFQGTGNRLGSANDPPPTSSAASGKSKRDSDLPARRVDPSLTQSDRDRQREARLAAAEKRQKASGVSTKKKKPTNSSQPLRGPNSEPLMRWTA